jgi:aminomethyltransferase
MQKTALNERHRRLGAKMTEFHGWEMPLYYTSIIEEHKTVRQALGIFDVSHMGHVLVTGPDAMDTLNHLLVSDIANVGVGRACYTLMLNDAGGILDDLIVFRLGSEEFLVIVNCATRTRDVEWLQAHRRPRTTVTDVSEGRAILAIQGPLACRALEQILDARVTSLGRFEMAPMRTMGPDACIARTGYTGGDGFELFVPDRHAVTLWDTILTEAQRHGVAPVGLGARDTLRVEAGLRLNGTDMDERTTPYEADLGWTVAINKPAFMGKDVLVKQRQSGVSRKFIGFELTHGPVPRHGCELIATPAGGGAGGRSVGVVTSGTFSPILHRPLGMGYVEPACSRPGTELSVTVRTQRYTATVVKLPFWKEERRQPALPANRAAQQLEQRS